MIASIFGKSGSRQREYSILLILVAVFLAAYFLPFEKLPTGSVVTNSLRESLLMLQDYARCHVLLCLVPALFIAGAISVFVSQTAVLKYFGAQANKFLAYGVASVSGTVLAVCSCTILPLFAGIYSRGAGIGPASAFLYSGPAINVLAIMLTARVLGWELGIARAVGAIVFSVVIGLAMHVLYRKEERDKNASEGFVLPEEDSHRSLWKNILYFAIMVGILVFANWSKPEQEEGFWYAVFSIKRVITGVLCVLLAAVLWFWFARQELSVWTSSSWGYAKKILPLLFIGVIVAGVLLGRPGHPALVPQQWISSSVGGNGLGANLFASIAGAFMYFATLTEIPILESLLGAGMGKGPALALLLAGPALSLPNMLVIRSVIGTQKTVVYVVLVVLLSTVAGVVFGTFF